MLIPSRLFPRGACIFSSSSRPLRLAMDLGWCMRSISLSSSAWSLSSPSLRCSSRVTCANWLHISSGFSSDKSLLLNALVMWLQETFLLPYCNVAFRFPFARIWGSNLCLLVIYHSLRSFRRGNACNLSSLLRTYRCICFCCTHF